MFVNEVTAPSPGRRQLVATAPEISHFTVPLESAYTGDSAMTGQQGEATGWAKKKKKSADLFYLSRYTAIMSIGKEWKGSF